MRYCIFDLETDGLLLELTKMHCLVAHTYEDNLMIGETIIRSPWELINFLENQELLIGHNIVMYDFPAIKKLTGYEHKGKLIDTLALSWYLYPKRKEHGLESWGDTVGIAKPKIEDWKGEENEIYVHRCRQDVLINTIIFGDFFSYIKEIYGTDTPFNIMYYLTWKMSCAQEQAENPLHIDIPYCQRTLDTITEVMEGRKAELSAVMPKVTKYKIVKVPNKLLKVNGELSIAGTKWLELLDSKGYSADYSQDIEVIDSIEDPNPTSVPQLKAWLFSLGWVPTLFEYKKNKAEELKAIPQLQDKDKKLCPNIEMLIEDHPQLELLKGLFMLQHRIGVLTGFIEKTNDKGEMVAEIAGFTNTLRFRHKKPIANLPSVDKPYGKQIRGAIIAPNDNYLFCGSDMSSLEDSTKQHYMYYYDPEYVKQMRVPGFDPHVDIALLAEIINEEDAAFLKHCNKMLKINPDHILSEDDSLRYKALNKKRKLGKIVNFSGIYGAGPPKIALTTGMPLAQAQILHKTYWKRNKAVKQIEADVVSQTIRKQMWLYNPVSKFWYSLRQPKDKFSTLNQGTGVYCFDTFILNARKQGIKISLQYHDEIGFTFLVELREAIIIKLNQAIQLTNEALKLNVPLGISIDIGHNYAESH